MSAVIKSNDQSVIVDLSTETTAPEVVQAKPLLTEIVVVGSRNTKMVYIPFSLRRAVYSENDSFGYEYDRFRSSALTQDETKAFKDPVELKLAKGNLRIRLSELIQYKGDFETVLSDSVDSNEELGREAKFVLDQIESEDAYISAKFAEGAALPVTMEEVASRLNTPNLLYTYEYNDSKLVFKTAKAKVVRTMMGTYIEIKAFIYVSTGPGQLSQRNVTLTAPGWIDEKTLSEVGMKEVKVGHPDLASFIERGKNYIKITSKPSYVQASGAGVRRTYWKDTYFRAEGRAMIDYLGMKEMDPNYNMYLGIDRYQDDDTKDPVAITYTDEIYALCSPVVYGFSFMAKRWGEFKVETITDIQFRKDAYDNLVMEKEQKDMIFALVDHVGVKAKSDVIDGKGGGTIFLLAGPPGVGKTLTAETIAERLQRPLYMVGIGELGTTPSELEESLSAVLNIAQSWNAVLLIDEADIFMEERSSMDVQRNAMVGIFLRLLEYYAGVLFLTTNRADNLDKAFFSRISMSLFYDKLSKADRIKIWKNFAKLNGFLFNDADFEKLSAHEVNGREIKNVVKLSIALAQKEKSDVKIEHISKVIAKGQHFKDRINVKKTFFGKLKAKFFGWLD